MLETAEYFSTPESFHSAKKRLLSGNIVRTPPSLLERYFRYCAEELDRVAEGLQLPTVLFHQPVTTSAEVQSVYWDENDIFKGIIRAQGKSCFWMINPNLEDAFLEATEARAEAARALSSSI